MAFGFQPALHVWPDRRFQGEPALEMPEARLFTRALYIHSVSR